MLLFSLMMFDAVQDRGLRTSKHLRSPATVLIEPDTSIIGSDVSSQLVGKIFVACKTPSTFQDIHLEWKKAESRPRVTSRDDDSVASVVGDCECFGATACELLSRSFASSRLASSLLGSRHDVNCSQRVFGVGREICGHTNARGYFAAVAWCLLATRGRDTKFDGRLLLFLPQRPPGSVTQGSVGEY